MRGQLADLLDASRSVVLKHGLRLRSDPDVRGGPSRAPGGYSSLVCLVASEKELLRRLAARNLRRPQFRAEAPSARPSRARSGPKIQYQIRRSNGTWATITTATLGTRGTATGKVTFTHTGTYTLRVYRPATTALPASYSPAWTVRVS